MYVRLAVFYASDIIIYFLFISSVSKWLLFICLFISSVGNILFFFGQKMLETFICFKRTTGCEFF